MFYAVFLYGCACFTNLLCHLIKSRKRFLLTGTETLEDLLGTLQKQMKSSDWLKQNTAEKWASENPDLAKEYMEAIKKS